MKIPRPNSLLGRIAGGLIAVSVLALATTFGLLFLEFKSTDRVLRQSTLQSNAEILRLALSLAADGRDLLIAPDAVDTFKENGILYAVTDDGGRLLAASDGLTRPLFRLPPIKANWSTFFVIRQPDGDHQFGLAKAVEIGGRLVSVQVASTDADVHLDSVVEEFINHLAWIWGPFVVILLAVNLLIIHRGLRPIRQASACAAAIGPRSVSARLPADDMPTEIAPLIQATNQAFDRLEQGFRAQQEFIFDAAHELRTPLAVLDAHLAALEDRSVAASLQQDLTIAERLVGQLLDMARVNALRLEADQSTDLNSLAVDVATHIAPLAVARGRSIEVLAGPSPVVVRGDGDSLFRAVRNLAENALAHTPAGTTVSIAVDPRPSISVSDHGPGIPPEQRDAIFQRYWQGNRDRSGGIGLGLAIVARTVKAHGGSIDVADAPGGGAVVTIGLPKTELSG